MSEVKHTRAPWIWGDDYKGLYGAGPNNEILKYDSYEGMWLAYEKTREANSLLIAAAPELLEAAKKALDVAESWIHDQLDGTSMLNGALNELSSVRAAIAKATGEQP